MGSLSLDGVLHITQKLEGKVGGGNSLDSYTQHIFFFHLCYLIVLSKSEVRDLQSSRTLKLQVPAAAASIMGSFATCGPSVLESHTFPTSE